MTAQFISFGEPPDTPGGDFEREVARTLRDKLPAHVTLAGSFGLAKNDSSFYELDLVAVAPGFCDILECKLMYPQVRVGEDTLRGTGGFVVDGVFSTLENKARVLSSRLQRDPFRCPDLHRINLRVIVPDTAEIKFDHAPHQRNDKVLTLSQAADFYRRATDGPATQQGNAWLTAVRSGLQRYRATYVRPSEGDGGKGRLGRFRIKRRLPAAEGCFEYLAYDEPPCPVEVHLREYPFDPLMKSDELQRQWEEIATEMRALRRIRHQYVLCVTGHFVTGSSLVQVSDWFDGQPLENSWGDVMGLPIADKLSFMARISEAMAFCHEKGVFHRNLSAASILIDASMDFRIAAFHFAKDLERTRTVSKAKMSERDPRLIAPEERTSNTPPNARLIDVFQAGVLFYRVCENGRWPYESGQAYTEGAEPITELENCGEAAVGSQVEDLIRSMMDLNPARRPDPFSRIAKVLWASASAFSQI